MDVDIIDETELSGFQSSKASSKRPLVVPVDDAHPFELESYISGYTGRTAVDRLIFLITICPALATHAFQLAVQQIMQLRDTGLLQTAVLAYNHARTLKEDLPLPNEVTPIDTAWVEETNKKNMAEKAKLEVELKTYSSNMIKESIRMAHRDLGSFYRSIGDHSSSMKHYSKSREFCTTTQHVLDMTMSVLELLMEQRNYAHVTTYVYKAEAALDAATGVRAAPTTVIQPLIQAPPGPGAPVREYVQTKLDVALAISYLGQGQYEKAAASFLKVGSVKGLEDWTTTLVAPGDVAVYGTLCALATYPRTSIRAQLLDNDSFGVFIEQEPYIRELLEAYMGSRFKVVLEVLERYSTRHYIDIILSPHVTHLISSIRERALILYFQPFASINLERMSSAFGWTVDYLEEQVVALIKKGNIQARVDRQNKVLRARTTDQRAALFARALKSGADIQSTNRKLLLRMKLQQADLVVKPPKTTSSYMQIQPRQTERE